jgi:hypothetical protein
MFKSKSGAARSTKIQFSIFYRVEWFVQSINEFVRLIRIAILPYVQAFTIDGARNIFYQTIIYLLIF